MILDLDGTLVDSESLGGRAFAELLPELGENADELAGRYRGIKFATILRDLEDRLDRPLPADFESRYRARVAALFDLELRPMPGAAEMIAALSVPCCVASNGPRRKMEHALRVTGLIDYFGDRLFSAYEVGAWKPDPGLFLHAAGAMGADPGACLVVEDTWIGIEAALAAGMRACRYEPVPETAEPPFRVMLISDLKSLPARLRDA